MTRSERCEHCFAPVPTGRFAYCSDLCQQRESHRRWFAAHPGYKQRKSREYRRKNGAQINARRRQIRTKVKGATA